MSRASSPVASQRVARGRRAENVAAQALQGVGYRIEARNLYLGGGEIDIVAWEGNTLCFVEVRARGLSRGISSAASITPAKRRHLGKAAQAYLMKLKRPWPPCRFDLVALDGVEGAEDISLHRNIFEVEP